jgi:hypothetical protein
MDTGEATPTEAKYPQNCEVHQLFIHMEKISTISTIRDLNANVTARN